TTLPAINGTIYVDKTGNTPGAFTTIQAAINSFSCTGINGNVTVNVVAGTGPYTEQVEIPEIGGASSSSRITLNGNNNTIQFDPVTGNRAIIRLNGADFITIQELTIKSTGTGTGTAQGAFGW